MATTSDPNGPTNHSDTGTSGDTPTSEKPYDAILDGIHPSVVRLLVADDDAATRMILRRRVADHPSVEMESVRDGAEALRAVRQSRFDAAVIDLHLPDMTGWQILEAIAQSLPAKAPRVTLYTGSELSSDEHARAEALGATVVHKDGSLESFERLRDWILAGNDDLARLRDALTEEGVRPEVSAYRRTSATESR